MLVIQNGTTQLISTKGQDSLNKLIHMVPGLISNLPDVIAKFTHKEETVGAEEDYHQMRNKNS